MLALCVSADRQRGEPIDSIAARAPLRKLPPRRGARACAGANRRAPAGVSPRRVGAGHVRRASWSRSGGRRPTSTRMMVVGARRGGTGSKYVTFRGGLRRAIPFLLVGSGACIKNPRSMWDETVLPAWVLRAESGFPLQQGRKGSGQGVKDPAAWLATSAPLRDCSASPPTRAGRAPTCVPRASLGRRRPPLQAALSRFERSERVRETAE
jgi:hypothetical protein